MLTRLRVRNLKRLDDIDIELGQNVLLIGPILYFRRWRCGLPG